MNYHFKILLAVSFIFATNLKLLCNSKQFDSSVISFPKTIIYSGMKLNVPPINLLNSGFSYIDVKSVTHPEKIPNPKKFILWTGIAKEDKNSPWIKEKSPYNINLDFYKKAWQRRLEYYDQKYELKKQKSKTGMIVLDIESCKTNKELNESILGKSSSEHQIDDYKKAMSKLYSQPLDFAKTNFNIYKLYSSYTDVPVTRTWWEIPNNTWQQWTSDPEVLNYITHQTKDANVSESNFSKSLDYYSVSTYYFYSSKFRDSQIANKYLAYMLFQLEVNKSWTSKPIYLFQTFRFQGDKERETFIDLNMVRNSVVFAFIAGADGIVLYDNFKNETASEEFLSLFDTFKESISNLAKYKSYFTGKTVYFKPENPRDLFANNMPVIRGIIKNKKLLLAATDPFQKENDEQTLTVECEGKKFNIHLHGNETILNEFEL